MTNLPANGNQDAITPLRRTLDLYKGELLPGCYDDWILPLREELHFPDSPTL